MVFDSGIDLVILGNISVIVIEEIVCDGVDGSILSSRFQLFLNLFIFQTEFIGIEANEMFLDILGPELFLNGVIDHKTDTGIIQDGIDRSLSTVEPAAAEGRVVGGLNRWCVCFLLDFVILRQIF